MAASTMKKAETATDKMENTDAPERLEGDETAAPTTEQLDELRTRAGKADEHWDRLLRTTADLENFKKRAAREKQDAIRFANESLIEQLLPVLDSFDMAMAAAETSSADAAPSLQAGIAMISQQLRKVLAGAGLEEIDATGQVFDPNFHQAVSQQESGQVPEGHVLQQLRKGYRLRDRLVRPASVVVATKPAGPASA